MRVTSVDYATYEAAKERLLADYAAIPRGEPVRLAKQTSNLFRQRAATTRPGLDAQPFDGVLSVDVEARTADVLGMTTYEHLVDATLPYGLMPLVVPQLRTITLGGAVTGLGIESSSYRNGLPHESVLELEVMTGDGRIVVATPDNEHAALFHGFPNSYGTLGYALRLKIELEPVRPFVRVRHVRHDDARTFFAAMETVCSTREYDGEPVDFVDGSLFSPDELYLTVGTFVDEAPYTSDYTGMGIYYRSLQQRNVDFLTVRDYLWRWDTDWFWCSRAFGVQNPRVRRLVPKRYLRSDTYWKVVALEDRFHVKGRYDKARHRPEIEKVVQDIEVPISLAPEFYEFFDREIGMRPIWACPLRLRRPEARWDLYLMDPAKFYVNFGFWGTVPIRPGETDGTRNQRIELKVAELGGRKSLYSTSYYEETEFREVYGGATYDLLKRTYDGDGRLLDLYDKCVRRR
jgi:FAD/FMN-containing dehydrogenase